MTSPRYLGVLWAVFLTVMGTLCVPGEASAATGKARAMEMFRKGCCCVTKPVSGCCCETKTPLSLNAPAVTSKDGLLGIVERVESPRGAQCGCGSTSDPATPASKSPSNSAEGEPDGGSTLPLEAFTMPERPAVASGRHVASRGSPPDSPLYLRHARLLI